MQAPVGNTPRVNGRLMASHSGRLVRLVGRVMGANNDIIDLEAADGARITVQRGSSAFPADEGQIIEIVGTVEDPTTLRESISYVWSEKTDLSVYNEMVNIASALPEVFGQ
eukprot:TRINITY_DN13599_c0_g1_i1.p2 TRINITY_DN13599_c0_g1~~TRINITY_DN13599_c0_g1_i1.p2  ORF type:complete len:111 (+),score=19.91 TRINITY_DN13599_c0_g1_i1:54-386(+)